MQIRTPLNGVIGALDLLATTSLDERQTRFAGIAGSSARALLELINEVLDFSKIEARQLELESRDFDLGTLVEQVVERFAAQAAAKGINLAGFVDPRLGGTLVGDPRRIEQVIANLVSNAVKFAERGSVVLRASLDSGSASQPRIRVTVEDSGIGIAADRLDRLFKPFSQGDASTTRKYGGTGLGLAICQRLIEAMGGEIGVDSQIGRGATFWFVVPLARRAEANARPKSSTFNGQRVLVVEECEVNREILAAQLAAWGLQVSTAVSVEAAIARLEAHPVTAQSRMRWRLSVCRRRERISCR